MIEAAQVISERHGIAFVTLDSLRYDVARAMLAAGRTPHLAGWLPGGRWEERRTPGTFTLPAHLAFFSGFLPKLAQPVQPPRLWECRPPAFKTIAPTTFVFDAPDLLTGLAQHGYHTVCIGGVTYFSRETPLGSVLPDMFAEDHWHPDFGSPAKDSTRHQINHALKVVHQHRRRPLFLFVNISATHVPHGHYLDQPDDTWESQGAALAYADRHLGRLLDGLAAVGPWLVILCADHGEAFGEDGYRGRGIAHPVVWTVPYRAFQLGVIS